MKETDPAQMYWDQHHDIPIFSSAMDFSYYIEKKVAEQKLTHIEALLAFCEEHRIESTEIALKVNSSLREKLKQEFRDINLLPKIPQLDL
jgi:hypothetical protein